MRRLAMVTLLPLVCLVGACDPCAGETCSGHGTCVVEDLGSVQRTGFTVVEWGGSEI